ncbi:hypothetical protein IQ25_03330 [Novosphingobium taihuense]|nr:hypothetical protein IQ25_03330 [Novosphingobium taihuense]
MVACILSINLDAGKRATVSVGAQSFDLDRPCNKKIIECISGLDAERKIAPSRVLAMTKLLATRRAFQFRGVDVGETDLLPVTADSVAVMH